MRTPTCFLLLTLALAGSPARAENVLDTVRDEARQSTAAHELLVEICDRFGGRPGGSATYRAAMEWLADRLRAEGLAPSLETFEFPGWERGEDRAALTAPLARPLRIAAIGYSNPAPEIEAPVVDIRQGRAEDFEGLVADGHVGLLAPHTAVPRGELWARAAAAGLRAVLFINREGGGQLLARTGSMRGHPLPLPVLSITQEEGRWMQRLLARGEPVRVKIAVHSRTVPAEGANLVVRFPGRSGAKLVVAGHADSWDLGQGAMDNGLGLAQLYEIARLLQRHSPENHHAVEIVWLDAEELGLWGSRERARRDAEEPVVAMINLDMVGFPASVNALGFDELRPTLEAYREALGADALPQGVVSTPWVASDHTPYMLAGHRAVTFGAPIPRESVRYYHDLADTVDKVSVEILQQSSAAAAALVVHLANDTTLEPRRRSPEEVTALFEQVDLVRRLQADGLWPFAP